MRVAFAFRIGVVTLLLALIAGSCSGSSSDSTASESSTTTSLSETTTTPGDDSGDAAEAAEPEETTEPDETAEPTEPDASGDADPPPLSITADQLCELMPLVEVGAAVNAQRDIITFASPSETSSICLLMISNEDNLTVNVTIELLSEAGEAGFEEQAGEISRVFASDTFEIDGIGNRAVGFEERVFFILVLAGDSAFLINGPPEDLTPDQVSEIGNLVASVLS